MRALIDTSVWLDLAKEYRNEPIIAALRELATTQTIELVVPDIVLAEFDKNRSRVEVEARKGLQSHFRFVREAVARFSDGEERDSVIAALYEIDHRSIIREAATDAMNRVNSLLRADKPIRASAAAKRRVTERALAGLAPYHRDKNSVADALLIEVYTEVVAQGGDCAFVTHNHRDFSDPEGDRRAPHPDLAHLFAEDRSTYWLSLVDLIRDIDSDLIEDHVFNFEHAQHPRSLSEILEAERLLFRQIWYNRHWNLRTRIEAGEVAVVPETEYSGTPYRDDQILHSVWARALEAANRTEKEVGLDNLGPWGDFEWGMLNGKLSALRWVAGDEWDMLDT